MKLFIIPIFIPQSGCPHQCIFCDQSRITGQKEEPRDTGWIRDTIERGLASNRIKPGLEVVVAFYGGNFSGLTLDRQEQLLREVQPFRQNGLVDYIRISTRPDAIDSPRLAFLKERGVKTIELGVQSLDDQVLGLSGRGHPAATAVEAAKLIKHFGFNLGIQLMTGLPGQDRDSVRRTTAVVISLGPDLVRIYPTLVIKDTPLARLYNQGRYQPQSLDEAVDQAAEMVAAFESAGIAVARVGLMITEDMMSSGAILAGPWHPAFGDLVKSQLLTDRIIADAAGRVDRAGEVSVMAHPRDLSLLTGHQRRGLGRVQLALNAGKVTLKPTEEVPVGYPHVI
ncbi:MAG: radical SAM protein [Deltaproteobacteria bacterium]|nr:radical SAM protein [Deltaproteobacteria bacterium]